MRPQALRFCADCQSASPFRKALSDGRKRLIQHGHGPERLVQTGIGPMPVRRVKLRDRGAGPEGERICFALDILPRWARRPPSLDALLPILYLPGVSVGYFQEALTYDSI